jgi:2-oxoisovalerate dehydrogenase E2 component (dihydrolipoyl transacylase)
LPVHVLMPQLGESVSQGTVERWLKKPGEPVRKYEPLVEVVTDKVNAEVPSTAAGIVRELLVREGETVAVGTPLCVIEEEGEAPGAEPAGGPGGAAEGEPAAAPGLGGPYSPVVRRLAAEHGVDLARVPGTGAGGRVTREDVLAFVAGRAAGPSEPQPAAGVSGAPPAGPDAELVPVTPVRRTIAQRMADSKRTIPHAWTMVECDVTGLVRLREAVLPDFRRREGFDLTYLPFFVKAVVEGLKAHPDLNAQWTEEGIIRHREIRLGIAVAREDGLVVPVLRGADGLSVAGLARSLRDLVVRAREGKLSVEDVQGGTFTVNNTGAFGSVASAPIINPPQAAIVTLEAVTRRPAVVGEGIAIRDMVNVCCSFDHRVLDGLTVGRFLQVVKRVLEGFAPGDPVY